VIDLPQAVDARFNPSALMLLQRDVSKLATHFRRYSLEVEPTTLTLDLWQRVQRGRSPAPPRWCERAIRRAGRHRRRTASPPCFRRCAR